ncbi:MAG: MFS transporter [Candidatus Aenigmarchaeota archaeon ex4484_14]|nr:MAG: MFS transporter [Candidatus Aenigmarchaeota archaeon ex4484_14]
MKNRRYLAGIGANVLLLGIVSFFNDMSSEMIMPILPLFITALGGTGIVVGLIGGLRDSLSSILKVVFGYWSDKTGKRKVFVSSGYIVSAVFKFMLSLSKAWQHVLAFASLERIGKGLRTAPRDAIIADSMPKHRGRGFGIHRLLDTSGAILGSIFVFILFWSLGFDFKTIILVAAVFSLVSLFPLYFVREQKRTKQKITFGLSLRSLPKSLRLFIIVSSVFALANFSYMFFILRAQSLFTGRVSVAVPILLYILFNIFYAGFAVPFGNLSDRIGRKKVLVSGYLLFSLTSLGFALFHSLSAFVVLFALYGIVYAIVDANQRALVSDLSAKQLRATALGTFHTMTGLMALPASLIAGFLWTISQQATFMYGAVVSLASVIVFLAFRRHFR